MVSRRIQKSEAFTSLFVRSLALASVLTVGLDSAASARPRAASTTSTPLSDDPSVRHCFKRVYENAGFGLDEGERAAWIIRVPGGFGCIDWPILVSTGRRVAWTAAIPRNVGWVHTHPHRSKRGRFLGTFSEVDKQSARRFGIVAYMLDRAGIWKFDPATNQVTREAGPNWFEREKAPRRAPQVVAIAAHSTAP